MSVIESTWQHEYITSNGIKLHYVTQGNIDAYKDAASKPGALTAMVNYYRNIFQPLSPNRKWRVLKVPTLMIWGENDTALGKELTYGTEAYVQDLQIQYIPNCSHWIQQEQPALVNQYMRDFLGKNTIYPDS
jgi:epoxide hydrolase 4